MLRQLDKEISKNRSENITITSNSSSAKRLILSQLAKTIREMSNQLFARKVLGPTGVLQMNLTITSVQIQPSKKVILKKPNKVTLTKVKQESGRKMHMYIMKNQLFTRMMPK
jgi:hypothetical protein